MFFQYNALRLQTLVFRFVFYEYLSHVEYPSTCRCCAKILHLVAEIQLCTYSQEHVFCDILSELVININVSLSHFCFVYCLYKTEY